MADMEKNINNEEEYEPIIYPLEDQDTGETINFELIAEGTVDGVLYYALVPAEEESDEYIILRATEDGEYLSLDPIEDDDEFDKVEEYFNDLLFGEADYDA